MKDTHIFFDEDRDQQNVIRFIQADMKPFLALIKTKLRTNISTHPSKN